MNQFIFTEYTAKVFDKHDFKIKNRVLKKLKLLKNHPNIFSICEVLVDFAPATHKLRIGNYRLILKFEKNGIFCVLDFGHRNKIYQ